MRGIDRMNTPHILRRLGELKSRGHSFKVRWERFKRDLRINLFMQRLVRIFNELSGKVVEAGSKAIYKKHFVK